MVPQRLNEERLAVPRGDAAAEHGDGRRHQPTAARSLRSRLAAPLSQIVTIGFAPQRPFSAAWRTVR